MSILTFYEIKQLKIESVKIIDYWKYEFTLRVGLEDDNELIIKWGGDRDNIYKFEWKNGWKEWDTEDLQSVIFNGEKINFKN